MDNYVNGSAVYNDELYACGNFEHADGLECLGIARWDGSAWAPVGGGFQHNAFSNVVYALTNFNNELVAGGYVDSVAGVPIRKVASWNGTSWNGMGTDCTINTIRCFTVHNGELYAGGEGSGALYPNSVEKWNGTNWVPIESNGPGTEVWSLASYNGELYACGNFLTFGGVTVNGIARWNGTTWTDVGGGVPGMTFTDIVKTLAVFNGKLYAGGHFLSMGGTAVNDLAAWDGSTWSDVGGGVGGSTAGVQSLLPMGDKLFVGGTFWTVNGITANRAAYWDGSAWTVLGTDLGAGARSQAVYNDELYSFGEGAFNGQNFAAKWTGATFSSISEQGDPAMMWMAPNPVDRGGTFSMQVGSTAVPSGSSIAMIGADGRIARQVMVHTAPGGRLDVPVGELAAGAYLVELFGRTGSLLARGRLVVH